MQRAKDPFWRVVGIMETLRGEGGCPWDREQTAESLKPYLIEETYEVIEAIETGDPESLEEELGDLLLQVIFHAILAREKGEFDISSVLENLAEKLMGRHPHVFGDVKDVQNSEDVVKHWEAIKGGEKNHSSVLSGVPRALPALLQARRIQEKAKRVGFDWSNVAPVWEKVKEEWGEFEEACEKGDKSGMTREFGDLLFALVNLSRFLGIDAEDALRQCNFRFIDRFSHMERSLKEKGVDLDKVGLDVMDKYWEEAKKLEK